MSPFKEAFDTVSALATDFEAHEKKYLAPEYNEAQVRKDFIDKFLTALGWDVDHTTQKNPYEQEVKVERNQRQGAANKKADYALSLAPNFRDVRLFVEAKKPHAVIDTADNYFQTIRYGWNSQNLVAVLTDFANLHIVDCRYKPSIDHALQRGWKRFHFREYKEEERFAEIYWLFSHEAVAAGSLNPETLLGLLPKAKGKAIQRGLFKGGHQGIDEVFLVELDEYRDTLARAFKRKNPELDSESLTEITQRTIDRLVFIRFLEDRLIEDRYHVANYGEQGSPWSDFIADSRRLDKIYNGIVFKEHRILDSPKFVADDEAFQGVCESLAHINSPYDFNVVPIHILGSIYEQFLGKVIIATATEASVEEKPEVRKAGGVYYTPEYIVRYIVEQTVGNIIDGKTPAQVAEMRFADVACGSGSFLLGVYDLLLRWHTAYYTSHPTTAKKGDLVERDDGMHLSLRKRREILLNNIYGVDIDAQAVEVAQLSLYLKLLQEETAGTRYGYQTEFHETLLPPLSKNIVCGNSLVGTDILSEELFEPTEERKLNPMDFATKFPDIMRKGGFNAIVGNPPYGAEFTPDAKSYLKQKFKHQNYQLESYLLFFEAALSKLLKEDGFFGMIIPNPWLTNLLQTRIRQFVVEENRVREIVHFRFPVFPKVTVDTEIVVVQKASGKSWSPTITLVNSLASFEGVGEAKTKSVVRQSQDRWCALRGGTINIFLSENQTNLASKCAAKGEPLSDLCEINVGIKPYQVGKGEPPQTKRTVKNRPFDSDHPKTDLHRQYLRGRDIGRYIISPLEKRYLKYGPWLAEPRPAANFDASEKIFMRQTGDSLVAALDSQKLLCLNNMHVIVPNSRKVSAKFLLGIINSKLMNWYYHTINPEIGEALAEVKRANVAKLPICGTNDGMAAQKALRTKMVLTVQQLIEAKHLVVTSQSDKDVAYYETKSFSLEEQIDKMVYKLYDLTEDEIQLVETDFKLA